MSEFSTCTRLSCRMEVPGAVKVCPACGGRMQRSGIVRLMGLLSIGCGLFLTLLIGVVAWHMTGPMLHPGQSVGGTTFAGTPAQAVLILALFGAIIAFGLTALLSGVVMAATGRRSLLLIVLTLLVAAVLVFAAGVTSYALRTPDTSAFGKPDQTWS